MKLKWDIGIIAALLLGGALVRIPYVSLIPPFEDEVIHAIYALSIWPGKFLPLKGLDYYSGPVFSYALAAWLRVFGATPESPRIFSLVLGTLTVGLTYVLARALGLNRRWAGWVGLLMAINPHHILINSHVFGSTNTAPLFSTAFMVALVLAVKRASGAWLVAAGVLLGLAMQTNPVPALMLPGVVIWFLVQRPPSIGLRTRWPYLAVAAFFLTYAPVIIYNLQYEFVGVSMVEIRSYVWKPDLSLPAFIRNCFRLVLQLCHQASGVPGNEDDWHTLIGLPTLFSAWAVASMFYAARPRQLIGLTALAVGSQVLIMPWLSNFYGEVLATRFTNQLTPLILVAMVFLAAEAWGRMRARLRGLDMGATSRVVGALLVAVSLWPLVSLFQYYRQQEALDQTNARYLAFFDEFMRQWRGEKIFLSETLGAFNTTEYFMAVNRVPYTLMPIGRILERLATGQETGRVTLVLHKEDLSRVQSQAELTAWDSPAMQAIHKLKYGVYTIKDAQQVRKPVFVLAASAPLASSVRAVQANWEDRLAVMGYEPSVDKAAPGVKLTVAVYWRALGAMTEDYTGFMHLVGPDGHLATQDDHELGRGLYRTMFWQPDELVREKYELTLPGDMPGGEYALWIGAYSFPSLERLAVRSASTRYQDNAVLLGTLRVEQ